MNKKIRTEAVDFLFDAILSLKDREECYLFFEDVCTINELLSLSQRFEVAKMLRQQKTYLEIAEKTAAYILREMTSPEGGFYSAQDADSEGVEGKYYLLSPDEVLNVLGDELGQAFNRHFDISERGNFERKNIPHLLKSQPTTEFDSCFAPLLEYRKQRYSLHLDDKVLTFWNSLMIAAMCHLFLVSGKQVYLTAAKRADEFIQKHLQEDSTLFVSFREGKRGVTGFLEDYAGYIFAQLSLHRATLQNVYAEQAELLCRKVMADFSDSSGGFYLYGRDGEKLILNPKETYDGAVPSGNSLMAYNLVRLAMLTGDEELYSAAQNQLDFLAAQAASYPTGYAMFLTALLDHTHSPTKIVIAPDAQDNLERLPLELPTNMVAVLLPNPTDEYPLVNNKTTYHICKEYSCMLPVNDLHELFDPSAY